MNRIRRSILSVVAAVAAAYAAVPGSLHAQELLAWPIGAQHAFRMLLPGAPIRPIPPRPLPHPPSPRPIPRLAPPDSESLRISGYAVTGNVSGQAAQLAYNITFHNPTDRRLEGVLVMPVPADTVLSEFKMTVGGKEMKGELLNAKEASTIYQNIVRQMRDPGLLELVGERMIRARVFPIEPNSDIVVKMTVNQILRKSGELYALNIPLRSAVMSGAESSGVSVKLNIAGPTPIRTIYSPLDGTHIRRRGARKAEVVYETAKTAEKDLTLFFSLQEDPLAASLLSFKQEGEDGFFLLSLSPRADAPEANIAPKDVVFVVDRSGSMEENGKMIQAKDALKFCVRKLRDGDRFGIVDFATDVNLFEKSLVSATGDNRARALRYIDRLDAAGGTNIEAGLRDGLNILTKTEGRVPMVFFLTDGLPTVGQTDMKNLLSSARSQNAALRARLFTFGVGDDVNTLFLDKLAENNRGDRDYVRSGETIEAKVGSLYKKIDRPALTDVSVRWEGLDALELYPRPITDIFFGGELTLMGRYAKPGKGRLIVEGKSGGKKARFSYPVVFPDRAEQNAFLPKLWANLKVTHELDALRLSSTGSADPEVVESIVRLAKRYGIVTPYTSYLITEEGFDMPAARREAGARLSRLSADANDSGVRGGAVTAIRAQKASSFLTSISGAFRGTVESASAPSSVRGLMNEAEKETRVSLKKRGVRTLKTKSIGEKTFYLRQGTWTDGEFDPSRKLPEIAVPYLSNKYFSLIERSPALARYLSAGRRSLVVYKGAVYRITP